MSFNNNESWNIIDAYFREPDALIAHQIDSFNQFINDIPDIFKEENPIIIENDIKPDESNNELKDAVKLKHLIEYKDIFLYKPFMNEIDGRTKPILPNECRLRNLTYQSMIYGNIYIVIGI